MGPEVSRSGYRERLKDAAATGLGNGANNCNGREPGWVGAGKKIHYDTLLKRSTVPAHSGTVLEAAGLGIG